ncbi:MAG: bifunctional DNA-formamidopyrimidine glycosylase/DNA-(apurinic or apyrimidinic site) lyase [Hyphomicrobiales bacterium]|nr:bifunctional DNA-formamidopyrimidine glycosylase/DNA-(apurinic or apyrimidinic site) lyase [Hyphomicrobiales bacterium]
MPELPEVETTRRGLSKSMVGRRVDKLELLRPDLRFPFEAGLRERIEGKTIDSIGRRAKYLLFRLSGGDTLVAHLGMSGSFRVEEATSAASTASLYRTVPRLDRHDHVVFHLPDDVRVVYNDPRRFGFMFIVEAGGMELHPRMRGIGLEPLEPPLSGPDLIAALSGATAPLKAALLDQSRIAGLGNIYVCEALHRSGLSPRRSAATLSLPTREARAASTRLAAAIRATLDEAIEAGGSTLRDFSGADGKPGYFQHSFRVYDREGAACPRKGCDGSIVREAQGGRSTFFCPSCQR